MSLPPVVQDLLNRALVSELTVVGTRGEPITHPLLPLWDGESIYMTSSVLFSRKLEHVKRNPRVSLAITDPVACGGMPARCTIQGEARVLEDDPHETWHRVLPLWRAKEPAIEAFIKQSFALPLFFERALIQVIPHRVFWWEDGDTAVAPQVADVAEAAR